RPPFFSLFPYTTLFRSLGFAGGPTCALEEAVLVQLVALLLGDFAEVDVVRFGAGEVQERRAVGVGLHRPQVHLEAAPELHGGAGDRKSTRLNSSHDQNS